MNVKGWKIYVLQNWAYDGVAVLDKVGFVEVNIIRDEEGNHIIYTMVSLSRI